VLKILPINFPKLKILAQILYFEKTLLTKNNFWVD